MWLLCLECGISSGCGCNPPPKVKYVPIDHEKELRQYEVDLHDELSPKYKPDKKAINNYFEKRRKDEN